MANILREAEAGILEFVKYRVPQGEWEELTSPASVLYRLEGDAEEELKDYIWSLIKQELDWTEILEEIETLRKGTLEEPQFEEEESEESEEDEIVSDSADSVS